jgi:hypothetical protein
MSSMSKELLAQTQYNGQKMAVVNVINALHALHPDAALTTSEAALFLRKSVSTMERMRKSGTGPAFIQDVAAGALGTNQSCAYLKKELIAWQGKNTVSSSMEAAIKKGQTFATLMDIAQEEAFYVAPTGEIESMVEENLLGTVVDRIGYWRIEWMPPVEAASRVWSSKASHDAFASGVQKVLSKAQASVNAGLNATDLSAEIPR